tara:strand:+ start:4959 stop:5432 length:474 start_codon:yes stop_codon:yes gene_type:complete
MDSNFNLGYIYFGVKTTNNSFKKDNDKDIVSKVANYLKDYSFSNSSIHLYNNKGIVYDACKSKTYRSKIMYSSINENCCCIYYQNDLIKNINFECNTDCLYEIHENCIKFIINDKINVYIGENNSIFIEFIKDAFFDENKEKINNIKYDILNIYNSQ